MHSNRFWRRAGPGDDRPVLPTSERDLEDCPASYNLSAVVPAGLGGPIKVAGRIEDQVPVWTLSIRGRVLKFVQHYLRPAAASFGVQRKYRTASQDIPVVILAEPGTTQNGCPIQIAFGIEDQGTGGVAPVR